MMLKICNLAELPPKPPLVVWILPHCLKWNLDFCLRVKHAVCKHKIHF